MGAEVIVVTDEDGSSDVVEVERIIRELHNRSRIDALATCGSNRLLFLLQRIGGELNISGEVAMEQHMGCALGMCFGCVKAFRVEPGSEVLTYRRICWDVPVFDVREAVSW